MSTRKTASKGLAGVVPDNVMESVETSFAEVVGLIEQARQRAYQAVNTELVALYWEIGQYISGKLSAALWGDGVVDRLAKHLARTMPGLRGFSAQNLWRMRQFFETYRDEPQLAPLVRALSWTHNLVIMGQSKRAEEREFYLRMASVRHRSHTISGTSTRPRPSMLRLRCVALAASRTRSSSSCR